MIDQDQYLGLKAIRKNKSVGDFLPSELGLKELLSRSWGSISSTQAIQAFCADLKLILEVEDLAELVRKIFVLQQLVSQLQEVNTDGEANWPHLDSFFRNLSPVLLQALFQHLQSVNDAGSLEMFDQWRSALRVALEEEYYLWQEKLLDA